MKNTGIKEGDWFILNESHAAVKDGWVPAGTVVEVTMPKIDDYFCIHVVEDGVKLIEYAIDETCVVNGLVTPVQKKKWEDIVAGDLFELTASFPSVKDDDCKAGTIVEITKQDLDFDWRFKEFKGDIYNVVMGDMNYIQEHELVQGRVKYVGHISTYGKCEGASCSTKYKSSTYDTEYASLEDALVDLILTDYFQNTVTFKNGMFGDMLLDTFTQEQKTDIVKWILGIETV